MHAAVLRHTALWRPVPTGGGGTFRQRGGTSVVWPTNILDTVSWQHANGRASPSRLPPPASLLVLEDNPIAELPAKYLRDLDPVEAMQVRYGMPGCIEFQRDQGGLPRVWMTHPHSSMGIEVYLHGACITQWLRPDAEPALYSPRADEQVKEDESIKAGVMVSFPAHRDGRENGFASRLQWEVVETGLDFWPTEERHQHQLAEHAGFGTGQYIPKHLQTEDDLISSGEAEELDEHLLHPEVEEALLEKQIEALAAQQGEEAAQPYRRRPFNWGLDGLDSTINFTAKPQREDEENDVEAILAADPTTIIDEGEYHVPVDRIIDLDESLDPAPYITLRLRDSDQTRDLFPHKFELLYTITLMDEDDMPPDMPEDAPTFSTEGIEARKRQESALEDLLESGEFEEGEEEDEEDDDAADVDASLSSQEDRVALEGTSTEAGEEGDAETADNEGVEDEEEEQESEDDVPQLLELETPKAKDESLGMGGVPVQLKLHFNLKNLDAEGSAPMEFQLAALAHLATRDLVKYGTFVKVLGLGGQMMYDYSRDVRYAMLNNYTADYLNFSGQRVDATFIQAIGNDVLMCPGDRTHFELLRRSNCPDVIAYHPGLDKSVVEDPARNYACLGAGHVAVPARLEPGGEWSSEFVLRLHPTYWREPIFAEGLPPMDEIPDVPTPGQGLDNLIDEDYYQPLDSDGMSVFSRPE